MKYVSMVVVSMLLYWKESDRPGLSSIDAHKEVTDIIEASLEQGAIGVKLLGAIIH